MQIESLEIFPTSMRLKNPVPMSSGVIDHTENAVVKLVTSEGLIGWGEGVEAPTLTGQRQSDIVAHLHQLKSVVIDSDPMRRNDLWARMRAAMPLAITAIGAVDIALHDLAGKALGVPVHQLLGGAVRDRVPALTLVGSGDIARDAEKLADRQAQGYRWFKIKLGMGPRDVELGTIAKAIELAGLDGVVCGDANEAWSEEVARTFLTALERFDVRFIEQPVARADREALLRLADSSPVELCADESAATLEAVTRLVGTAIGGVSLKLIKHGGITGVMRGANICSSGGLEINLAGKVIESSISAAANLHCAAAIERLEYGCSLANQDVVQDVTENPIRFDGGQFDIPQEPGLGVDVDEELLIHLGS